ncbi:MAG: NADH-quinone oxidoreductase subunit H [Spirochaetes bacterium]|nr:NADH-quinone oxidoreductase subunit H [Spirochaetota bacterium]
MVSILLYIFALSIAPFLFMGIIIRVKAFWAGRKGPPLLQPLYDFIKLLRKGEVISASASFIFTVAPLVCTSAVLGASLLIPFAGRAVISLNGGIVLFCYLLALSRFFLLLSALDVASSFEGMGASREATFAAFAETGLFFLLGTFAAATGNTSFTAITAAIERNTTWGILIICLWSIALFLLMLVEGSRMPVDDPNTHLELTMIHEVIVLDNSGVNFAFMLYASHLKVILFGSLIAALVIPSHLAWYYYAAAWALVLTTLAVVIGILESILARLRMTLVPQFIFLVTAMTAISALLIAVYKGGI